MSANVDGNVEDTVADTLVNDKPMDDKKDETVDPKEGNARKRPAASGDQKDVMLEQQNVTARKKNRPKINNDSDEDSIDIVSAKKNRIDMNNYHPGNARRNINGALRSVENKGLRTPGVANNQDVVSVLLKAHMESKRVINSSNCFEKQTVLDFISKKSIMQESIQDMAFVLDSAVNVYTIRVDRTHGLTMAVKSNVNNGVAEKDEGVTTKETRAEMKEEKKHAAKRMLGDWKSKFEAEEGERELTPQPEDENDDDEQDEADVDHAEEDNWLSRIPENIEEVDAFLKGIINYRKHMNAKLNTLNHVLTDDGDVLLDRNIKEVSSNEYYDKAVSRYGEGTSASLLMNNAKCTSDGKAYLLHARVPKSTSKVPERASGGFTKGVELTLSNALSERPGRIFQDLLPNSDVLLANRGTSDSEDDDEAGTIRDAMDGSTSGLATGQMDRTVADATMMPNMTIVDATMMPNMTLAAAPSHRRKTAVFRGRDMNPMWVSDDIDLQLPTSSYEEDQLELTRIYNLRHQNMLPTEIRGRLPAELSITDEEFRDRIKPVEVAGIADELRELDSLWNAQVVRRVVTEDEAEEQFRHAVDLGGSEEEIRTRKKKVLGPGTYTFFMEADGGHNHLIPVDQWADEGTQTADVSVIEDIFFDANDDDMFGAGGGFSPIANDIDLQDDLLQQNLSEEEKTAQAVRAVMENNHLNSSNDRLQLDAPSDDIADVPVNPGAVMEGPDEALRNMGKEDDAHWKGNKSEPEKKERTKKDKKTEDKSVNVDSYFAVSTEEDRLAAKKRFKVVKASLLEKEEKLLFMKRKPLERRPHLAYNFEDFVKPGLLNIGRYHGLRFQRTNNGARFNRAAEMLVNDDENADDIVGREWMQLFSGLILRENADDEEETYHSPQGSIAGQSIENMSDLEEEEEINNIGEDFDDDGVTDLDGDMDSFHSALQQPDQINSPDLLTPVPPPVRSKHDNIMYELQQMQGDDSDEEEGEVVYMLDRKVVIKNTNIDQSKVKSYLKSILTNPLMDINSLKAVSRTADESFNTTNDSPEKNGTLLAGIDAHDESSTNPLEVTRMIFAPVDEQSQISGSQLKHVATPGKDSLSNAVVLSDFDIKGEHTLTSLMACLPFRALRPHEKSMHVSFAFSIALQMCNENTLQCIQNKSSEVSGKSEDWMGDFILRNGSSTAGDQPTTSS